MDQSQAATSDLAMDRSQTATNAPASQKRHSGGEFEDINEVMYTWYSLARQHSVTVSGPMLQ